ncbi:MAG: hypothetical protein KAT90_13080 [Gammaproteobacteria bacterium]|nr:hypothetical protein [Gammaproteobacteria bacterium]
MRKLVFLVSLIFVSNISQASDMLWYWDNDGATKGLLPDPKCQCYFSLEFPVKVVPKAGAHFMLYETNSQIVTLKTDQFVNLITNQEPHDHILSKHVDYELNYLSGVVGEDKLLIESKEWDKNKGILTWVLKRESKKGASYLVSSSVVKSDCIFYISSLVSNKASIQKVSDAQHGSLHTLKTHTPTSEEEAKQLITELTKS